MTTTEIEAEVTTMKTALRVADRCDGCGVQAFVRVDLKGSELLFCAHDYARAEKSLTAAGAIITEDRRDALKAKPAI